MNEELANVTGENAEQEKERIRIQYGLKVRELRNHNLKLQNEEFESMQTIKELEDRIYQSKLDELKKLKKAGSRKLRTSTKRKKNC